MAVEMKKKKKKRKYISLSHCTHGLRQDSLKIKTIAKFID